jgi:hypothetical protein
MRLLYDERSTNAGFPKQYDYECAYEYHSEYDYDYRKIYAYDFFLLMFVNTIH